MASSEKDHFSGLDDVEINNSSYTSKSTFEANEASTGYHGKSTAPHSTLANAIKEHDVFGNEDGAAIKYKTLSWQLCAILMIAEIVSNGMLSLPAALAVVGIVPGVVLIAFLGVFALYTSLVLVDFKLRHPEVHNMGDAGRIMGGPILREILAAGTVIFAICATGSQLLAGQIALSTLSGNKLCLMLYTGQRRPPR